MYSGTCVLWYMCTVVHVYCGTCTLWYMCTVVHVYCGTCVLWYMCTVVHVYCGTCVQWYMYTVVHVYCGTCVLWYMCTVVHVHCGTCVQWYMCTVVHVYSGTCVQWYMYTVVHVYCGTCVHLPIPPYHQTHIRCPSQNITVANCIIIFVYTFLILGGGWGGVGRGWGAQYTVIALYAQVTSVPILKGYESTHIREIPKIVLTVRHACTYRTLVYVMAKHGCP